MIIGYNQKLLADAEVRKDGVENGVARDLLAGDFADGGDCDA